MGMQVNTCTIGISPSKDKTNGSKGPVWSNWNWLTLGLANLSGSGSSTSSTSSSSSRSPPIRSWVCLWWLCGWIGGKKEESWRRRSCWDREVFGGFQEIVSKLCKIEVCYALCLLYSKQLASDAWSGMGYGVRGEFGFARG